MSTVVRTNAEEVEVTTAATEKLLDLWQRWTRFRDDEVTPGLRHLNRELDAAIAHDFDTLPQLKADADHDEEIRAELVRDIEVLERELDRRGVPLPELE